MLEVRLLGMFDIKYKKKPVSIVSRPAQSLFAYLILNAGTAHRREKLAGLLWPDSLQETARDNLRHALWRLRKALEAASSTRFLHANDVTISFKELPDYWCDTAELGKLGKDASADELMAILSNYQGELLPGFYDEWVVLEREHLHSIFEHHMARLMSLLQDEKRSLDIFDWGERWIKLGQKPEPAYRALMVAHAAKGDMSKVAAMYERCVRSLKEFGVEPSEQTRALYERVKAGKEILEAGPTIAAKEKRSEPPKTNLPVPLTSFIGREREIEEVKHLLSSTRLLTLTGLGGIGKTRLAIQAANELIKSYKDGVWWVELAPLMDEGLVPQAVAQVLGVRESPGQPLTESVKNYLYKKQLLLILDNCEHLIAACAQFAHDLLTQCANLRILTTSREALGITGETTLHVPALSFPVLANLSQMQNLKEFESVRLFVERAAAARPDLALTQQNAFAVTQICHRLDGIPLALELAAARVKVLSLEEIAARLEDRFHLLTQGSRTAMPRHQTLHAAIDWSYELLSDKEPILLRRLAVFAGGWTLEEAHEICSGDNIKVEEILDLLAHLVDKSLVNLQTKDGDTRYRMLETIRQYAHEKLVESGEEERVQKQHLEFFVQLAEEADPKLNGPEQVAWLDRLETEHDNLRHALGWALEHYNMEGAARLGPALFWFWVFRTHLEEGWRWLEQIIELSRRMPRMEQMSPNTEALFAHVLNCASVLAYYRSKETIALLSAEEGLALSRKLENKKLIIEALFPLGTLVQNLGNYARAGALFEENLTISREVGEEWEVARALMLLGNLALNQKNYVSARTRYEEGLTLSRDIGNKLYISIFSINLGHLALNERNYTAAQELFTEAMLLAREVSSERFMIVCLVGWAALARALEQLERATRLSGAMDALCESIGSRLDQEEQVEHERTLSMARAQLDEATFNRLWSEGSAMTLEQAIDFALKETQQ